MIEQGIMARLRATTAVTDLVGTNIFYHQAPKDAVFPWVIIQNSGGSKTKIGLANSSNCLTDNRDTVQIYVDDDKQFRGREIAVEVQKALNNYRGNLAPANDVHLTSDTIRDLDGWNDTFRYIFPIYARYLENTNIPS